MQKISLEEHIRQSHIAAQANKLKGNRHGQILSGLYTDPAHLIEELIQNAEDAYSRLNKKDIPAKILFELDRYGLHIFHNGKDFDEADLMAITTFAVTTKKGDKNINMIGKFGIGFRSVFGISDRPEIHSGPYNYCISDFEVLEAATPKGKHGFRTYIYLPFKKGINPAAVESIENGLMQLSYKSLLFLEHIDSIEVITSKGNLNLNKVIQEQDEYCRDIRFERDEVDKKISSTFRLYQYKKGNHAFGLAFAIKPENGNYFPIDNQQLSVYFPTLHPLNLSFAIHGNFTTTPNREQVPFNESLAAENLNKLKLLSSFIKKVLIRESHKGRINASFFKLIAFEHRTNDLFNRTIINAIDEVVATSSVLAGEHGGMHKPEELCWPEDAAMRQLLKRHEIRQWFSRIDWLHHDFAEQTEFLHHLIKNHKLKKADNESFAFYISYHPEHLQKKSIEWFVSFFRYLVKHPPLWNREKDGSYFNLRHKAIIPNQKRKPMVPFDHHGQAMLHLGDSQGQLQIVHPLLQQDPVCNDFFKMLGLPEAKSENNLLEKLLNKSAKITHRNASSWLFELYELYVKQEELILNRIRNSLAEFACIPCVSGGNDTIILLPASEAYLPLNHLKQWFRYNGIAYVSKPLFQYFKNKGVSESNLMEYLTFLNVNRLPKRIETKNDFDVNTLKSLRGELDFSPIVKQEIKDYQLDGLEQFVENPSVRSAAALLQFLNEMPASYVQGSYSWESYIRTEHTGFDAAFIRQLREIAWIPDEQGNFKFPSDLSPDNIHPLCRVNIDQWEKLIMLLHFKERINQPISDTEMKLILSLREKNIQPESLILQKEVKEYPKHITLLPYIPIETNQSKVQQGAPMSGQISLFHNTQQGQSSSVFELPIRYTAMTFRYLSTERYAHSLGLVIKEIRPGYFQMTKDDVFISHIFCSGFQTTGESIVLDPRLSELMNEKADRKDIVLYIWEEGIAGTLLHEIEHIKSFLEQHPFKIPLITTQW